MRWFWRLRYRVWSRDLRAGRGTRDNPLTMADIEPVLKALRRLGLSKGTH
jgi:hypothetical protein